MNSPTPTQESLTDKTTSMSTKLINGQFHVLAPDLTGLRNPNYLGTGLGLVGILRTGESLSSFKEYWLKRKLAIHQGRWHYIVQIKRKGNL